MFKRRVLAALCAALVFAPAAEASTRTLSVPALCKYPLIELREDTIAVTVEAPQAGNAGVPVSVGITSTRWKSVGLGLLAGITDLAGVSVPDGETRVDVAAGTWSRPLTIPTALSSSATQGDVPTILTRSGGSERSLTINEPGSAVLGATGWRFNIRGTDEAGAALTFPPVSKDAAGNKVSDSDGDPNTFDVYCVPKVAPLPTYGAIDVAPRAIPAAQLGATAATPRAATVPVICKYPLISNASDTIGLTLDASASLESGSQAKASVGAVSWSSLGLSRLANFVVDFASVRGAGQVQLGMSSGAWTKASAFPSVPFGVTTVAPEQDINTPTRVSGVPGSPVAFTLNEPGTTLLQARGWRFNLEARDSDGAVLTLPPVTKDTYGNPVSDSDGNPNTFDVYCVPGTSPTTQTPGPSHGTINVTAPQASLDANFNVKGTVTLPKLAKAPVPVTGSFTGKFDTASGALGGSLALNDTQIRLVSPSATSVTATIGFVPTSTLAGSYRGGLLTAAQSVRLKVKSVKLYGAIPIAMGNTCQTKAISSLPFRSDASGGVFAPITGGPLAATFNISDLNGCTGLEGILDPATASSGNSLALTLARP